MARALQSEWQNDAAGLGVAYRKAKDTQERQRLHALWLLRHSNPRAETGDILGVYYRTAQKWVAGYRHGGIAVVLSPRHGGSRILARRSTAEQAAACNRKQMPARSGGLKMARAGPRRPLHTGTRVTYLPVWGCDRKYPARTIPKRRQQRRPLGKRKGGD